MRTYDSGPILMDIFIMTQYLQKYSSNFLKRNSASRRVKEKIIALRKKGNPFPQWMFRKHTKLKAFPRITNKYNIKIQLLVKILINEFTYVDNNNELRLNEHIIVHEDLREYGYPYPIETLFNNTVVRVKEIIRIHSHNTNNIPIYATKLKVN